jgi:formimidoylglutamate deiminase
MTHCYFADHALLPTGWASQVLFEVDATGMLISVQPNATPGNAERLAGAALPHMPFNAPWRAWRKLVAHNLIASGAGETACMAWSTA